MYKDNTRTEPLFCSLNLLFSDVPVAVVVVVIFNSLLKAYVLPHAVPSPAEDKQEGGNLPPVFPRREGTASRWERIQLHVGYDFSIPGPLVLRIALN